MFMLTFVCMSTHMSVHASVHRYDMQEAFAEVEADARVAFEALDRDGSGAVDYQEFCQLLTTEEMRYKDTVHGYSTRI